MSNIINFEERQFEKIIKDLHHSTYEYTSYDEIKEFLQKFLKELTSEELYSHWKKFYNLFNNLDFNIKVLEMVQKNFNYIRKNKTLFLNLTGTCVMSISLKSPNNKSMDDVKHQFNKSMDYILH